MSGSDGIGDGGREADQLLSRRCALRVNPRTERVDLGIEAIDLDAEKGEAADHHGTQHAEDDLVPVHGAFEPSQPFAKVHFRHRVLLYAPERSTIAASTAPDQAACM